MREIGNVDIGMLKTSLLERVKTLAPVFDEIVELVFSLDRIVISQRNKTDINGVRRTHYRPDDRGMGRRNRVELVAYILERANNLCMDQTVASKDIPDTSARDAGIADLFVLVLLFAAYAEVDLSARLYDKLLFEATGRQPIRPVRTRKVPRGH